MSYETQTLDLEGVSAKNLNGLSLKIPLGTTAIMGPRGSGKSALLKFIIGGESKRRTDLLADPFQSQIAPEVEQKISGLPLSILYSGEDKPASSGTIGSELGINRELFEVMAKSELFRCFNCRAIHKISTEADHVLASIQSYAESNTIPIKLFVLDDAPQALLEDKKNSWARLGYEKIYECSNIESKTTTLYIEIDAMLHEECLPQRISESLQLCKNFNLDIAWLQSSHIKTPLDLTLARKIANSSKCQACFHPRMKAYYENISLQSVTAAENELSEEEWLVLFGKVTELETPYSFKDIILKSATEISDINFISRGLSKDTLDFLQIITKTSVGSQPIIAAVKDLDFIEQQLIGVIKTFRLAPKNSLIILDEPIFELSQNHQETIRNLFLHHRAKGGYILLASNQPGILNLCEDTVVLNDSLAPNLFNQSGSTEPYLDKNKPPKLESEKSTEIIVDYERLFSTPYKSVCEYLHIHEDIAGLFGATTEAKALGLSKQNFLTPSKIDRRSLLLTFAGLSLPEFYELSLTEARSKLIDVLKISRKLEIACYLKLEHLLLSRTLSDLSLRERVLLVITELIASKPKNKTIRLKGLTNLLEPEDKASATHLLVSNLSTNNVVAIC